MRQLEFSPIICNVFESRQQPGKVREDFLWDLIRQSGFNAYHALILCWALLSCPNRQIALEAAGIFRRLLPEVDQLTADVADEIIRNIVAKIVTTQV